jgi:hypothetical protein
MLAGQLASVKEVVLVYDSVMVLAYSKALVMAYW